MLCTIHFSKPEDFVGYESWKVRANAYDMVLNGNEIGVDRFVFDKATQQLMFKYLGLLRKPKAQRILDGRISVCRSHGGV
jgi:aspartyl-tRNA synthetase